MRKLTFTRRKTFVGCAMKLHVYISDPVFPEIVINGIPCKKLGELKSGQTQTYEIENTPLALFTIFDLYSKDTFNTCKHLPAGDADIVVSGKNHFSPFRGNPFVFDE